MLTMPCDCTGTFDEFQLLWKRLDGHRNDAFSIVTLARFMSTLVPAAPVPTHTVNPSLNVTPTVESTDFCPNRPSVTRNVLLPPKDHCPPAKMSRYGFTSPLTVMFVTVPLAGNTAVLPSVHAQAVPLASCQFTAAASHTDDSVPVHVRSAAWATPMKPATASSLAILFMSAFLVSQRWDCSVVSPCVG